jgi:hypothetical protein
LEKHQERLDFVLSFH